jgi:hypothetical protein
MATVRRERVVIAVDGVPYRYVVFYDCLVLRGSNFEHVVTAENEHERLILNCASPFRPPPSTMPPSTVHHDGQRSVATTVLATAANLRHGQHKPQTHSPTHTKVIYSCPDHQ